MSIPIMLNIKDKKVLVVGGGNVALRRTKKILNEDCQVICISKEFHQGFCELENVVLKESPYCEKWLKDTFLVIAATSDKCVNEKIKNDCNRLGILCSIADNPAESDLTFPAITRNGDLTVAVSTGGNSPKLAKKMIKDIKTITDSVSAYRLELLGEIRREVLEHITEIKEKEKILSDIIWYDETSLEDVLINIKMDLKSKK